MQTTPPAEPSPTAQLPPTGGTGVTGTTGVTASTGQTEHPQGIVAKTEQAAKDAANLARQFVPDALAVVLILVMAWFFAAWTRRTVRRTLDRARFDPTLGKFFTNVLRWAILTLAVIMCLRRFGFETTSFVAIIGAAGFAVGFALQGSLANLAAGVLLLVFRPFKVGDSIMAAGQAGKVNEIDLFQTTLDTTDGRRVIVPNGPIFAGVIENSTYHPRRRIDVPLTVGLGPSIDQTRQALHRAVKRVPHVLPDFPADVTPLGFPVAGVDWVVSVWARTDQMGGVKADLIEAIKDELDKAEIPLKK